MKRIQADPYEVAQEWLGLSLEKPEPGERIDRVQLGEQLQACSINADVEDVAQSIEDICNQSG